MDMPLLLVRLWLSGLSILVFIGCGSEHEGVPLDGLEVPGKSAFFQCNQQGVPSVRPLRRLSKVELKNTLSDLLIGFSDDEKANLFQQLALRWEKIPRDSHIGLFKSFDQRISPQHLEGQYYFVKEYLELVFAKISGKEFFSSCDLTREPSENCVEEFLSRYLLRAFRRPVSKDELATFMDFYRTQGLKSTWARILLGPDFLYHMETMGTEVAPEVLALTSYEFASRLAYTYWQSPPDQWLLQMAAEGELETIDGVSRVVEKMWQPPYLEKVKKTLESFYSQWLSLETRPNFDIENNRALATLAQGENIGQPGYQHREDMVQELKDLFNYYLWQQPGGMKDLLTSRRSFAWTPALAKIYGVRTRRTEQETIDLGPDRAGLLTRAGMLITGAAVTSPIHQGVFIRRNLLCDQLGDPPANLAGAILPPPFDPTKSTRQSIADNTSGNQCIGCHRLINPLGFAFENFDALGRLRKDNFERIISSGGEILARQPVDTQVQATLHWPDGEKPFKDGVELSREIARTGKADACFARQFFRFTQKQMETELEDGCVLESLYEKSLKQGFLPMFKELGLRPEFRQRRVE